MLIWVNNDEENIKDCSRKKCQENHLQIDIVRAEDHN